MSELRVARWDREVDGRCDAERLRARLEAHGYAVTTYRYPPGTRFETHTHDVDKCDAVVCGRFRISSGSESVVLEAGDMMFVPAGTEHAAEVVGGEPVVSLDGIARND